MFKSVRTDIMSVWKSVTDQYYWRVFENGGPDKLLARGYADTFEQAFRNARNYIKNNQSKVYGDGSH